MSLKQLAEVLLEELPAIHPDRRAVLEKLAGHDQEDDDHDQEAAAAPVKHSANQKGK